MLPRVLAIVGVGLIGGSVGLAARRGGATRVLGVDRNADALGRARERGIIDEGCHDLQTAAGHADLILFCTPVDVIANQVVTAAQACRTGTVLTDVGSVKASVVRAVRGLPAGIAFVGGHPLAGSEKQGPEHADADLFRNRLVVLTAGDASTDDAVARVQTFWESLGAQVRCMTPEAHDHALALTSHLPHLVASALAGVLPPEFAELTANGFRDTTRIAEGDPDLWCAILDGNRGELLKALDVLLARLGQFRESIASGERKALRELLVGGRASRRLTRRHS
jgi:prephenate dehydrogenase